MGKKYAGSISSTQVGAVAESLVAMRLMVASAGRLSPYRPLADDAGIDVLIHDKHTGAAIPLQIKSRTGTLRANPNTVHFEVRLATFRSIPGAFLLAVLFDQATLLEKRVWLVPMNRLEKVCRRGAVKLVMRPSIKMNSKDRYSEFRCENLVIAAERLVAYLEQVASAQGLRRRRR